jgi:dCMP deaminase
MMGIAKALAMRGACMRLQVGCVITDKKNRILGSGYNGKPRSLPNCNAMSPCVGACQGVHAEINALLQAPPDKVYVVYTTHFPCHHCAKSLANTTMQMLCYADDSIAEPKAVELMKSLSVILVKMPSAI